MDPSLSNLILEMADKFVSANNDITITQALLLAANQFLTDRKFQLCREAAVVAQTYEPDIPGVSQILAVANTLMAAETPISENLPDCYAILEVPRYSEDFLEIKDQYKKLCLLLDPNETLPWEDEVPLAPEAFSYVNKAWYELSVKSRKSQYDGNLLKFIQESGPKPPRKPINRSEEEESKTPIKSRRSKRRSGLKMRANGEPYDAVGEDDHHAGEKIWAKCLYCTRGYEYNVSKGYDKDECLLRCKNEECKEEFFASGGKLPPLKKMNIDRTGINLSMVEAAEDGAADNDNGNGDGNAAGEDVGANNDDKQLKSEDLQPGKKSLWRLMKVNPDTGKYDQEVDEHDLKVLNEIEKKNQENELKTEKNVSVQGAGFDLDPAEACYIIWLTCPYCEHQNVYNLRDATDDNDGRLSCKDKGCRGDFDPSETMEFKRAQ